MDKATMAALERRVYNWGAWARQGAASQGRCGSAEGGYVIPRDDDGERLGALSHDPINVADAELLDAAIAALPRGGQNAVFTLFTRGNPPPSTAKTLLVAYYQARLPPALILKQTGIRPSLLDAARITALGLLQRVLDDKTYQGVIARRATALLHSASASNKYEKPLTNVASAP